MRRGSSLVVPWMSLGWGLVASKSTVIVTWVAYDCRGVLFCALVLHQVLVGCLLDVSWMCLGCTLDETWLFFGCLEWGYRLCPEQTVTVTWIVKSPSVMSQNLVLKKKRKGWASRPASQLPMPNPVFSAWGRRTHLLWIASEVIVNATSKQKGDFTNLSRPRSL